MGKGIDYGMGMTNIDRENGIRFGVINTNAETLTEWFWESVEADYGPPTCGKCGNEAVEYDSDTHDSYKHGRGCADYACEHCERVFGSDDAFGDEPNGHTIDDDGVIATVDGYNDVFITKSPYYTRAAFCSPCAPGACHLENPDDDGEKAYCLGHDWFRDKTAPYPVYRVDNDELVPPG